MNSQLHSGAADTFKLKLRNIQISQSEGTRRTPRWTAPFWESEHSSSASCLGSASISGTESIVTHSTGHLGLFVTENGSQAQIITVLYEVALCFCGVFCADEGREEASWQVRTLTAVSEGCSWMASLKSRLCFIQTFICVKVSERVRGPGIMGSTGEPTPSCSLQRPPHPAVIIWGLRGDVGADEFHISYCNQRVRGRLHTFAPSPSLCAAFIALISFWFLRLCCETETVPCFSLWAWNAAVPLMSTWAPKVHFTHFVKKCSFWCLIFQAASPVFYPHRRL